MNDVDKYIKEQELWLRQTEGMMTIHDQACIQRDAVINIVNRCRTSAMLHDALYDYFYEQVKRKP